jgi:glycosyl hydrolase family 42 (putative beta-galactosidase)
MSRRLTRAINALLHLAAGLLLGCHALAALAEPSKPLFITPMVEGLLICDELKHSQDTHLTGANSYCTANGLSGARATAKLLDELEPGGPMGKIQVGYTMTVQLLSLYRLQNGRWMIDEARIDRIVEMLDKIKRPAVLYLAANHFDTQGAITQALESDPRNLMHLADGTVPRSNYHGYKVVPYTLQTDESIPVNRYRFEALQRVAARIAALPQALRDRLVAITLAGEVHHMFPEFHKGTDSYENVRVTDYSPQSVTGFRAWLRQKHGSVQRLNQATGGAFRSFEEVSAPARNLLAQPGGALADHYDAFADGRVPVAGWLWDPQRRVTGLELHVDGQRVAELARDFNRLDVYRALDEVDDPSVGFRHDLDISRWAQGSYALQVVARTAQGTYELGQSQLVVVTHKKSAGALSDSPTHAAKPAKLPKLETLQGVRAWLDVPKATQQVLFNPLAREWNSYRSWQVNSFIARFYAIARSAGLPSDKLYSHQIVTRVNSAWNGQFFASDESIGGKLPWKQGFNTYGGAAGGSWITRYVREQHLSDYGVPEFHPQQWKRPDAARKALALHRRLGARFVSPYYHSVTADRNQKTGANLNQLEIRPNNTLDGSDQLFHAIKELAAQ